MKYFSDATDAELAELFPGALEAGFTRAEMRAVIGVLEAMALGIKEAGPDGIPSGHLYAAVMHLVPLSFFQRAITIFKRMGLVAESFHVLTWIEKS